ncbi:hypothetical protein [Variovorax sp. GB1P17]|uniref:hypothetical protein n=1 Tax=Variovorax sp. GB1P17 TaxID=3443740 RepID=UPI003F460EBB
MNHTSLIQIIKVGPVQDKTFEGRAYQVQEAECILLNEDGTPEAVGVLRLDDKMRGQNAPIVGTYSAKFSLKPSPKDRKIGAVLTGLTAIVKQAQPQPPKP